MGIVLASTRVIHWIPETGLEKYAHALAGAIISFCGIAIQFFGM